MDRTMAICVNNVEDQSPSLLLNTGAGSSDDVHTITKIPYTLQNPSIHPVCKLTRKRDSFQHEGCSQYFPQSMQDILPIPAKCFSSVPVREIFLTFANP